MQNGLKIVSGARLQPSPNANSRKRNQNSSEHALACFCAAFKSMRSRKQIELELMERIFDAAETFSLDGETPSPATAIIRSAWDRLVG